MKIEVIRELTSQFESIFHKADDVEFWFARELQELLGYSQWRNFQPVIEKAKIACRNAGQDVDDHFADVRKMVSIGSETQREIEDIMLTRYACYLIAQNGDPRKEQVAFAMSYFAVQTRKQEVLEQRMNDWERLQAREKLTLSEHEFSSIIYEMRVDEIEVYPPDDELPKLSDLRGIAPNATGDLSSEEFIRGLRNEW